MPELLRLEPYGALVLGMQAADVAFPLSASDRSLIDSMLFSIEPEQLRAAGAPWPEAAGMAAPQWGRSRRIFLCAREYIRNSSEPALAKTLGGSPKFVVAINPEYSASALADGEAEAESWEGCFSVPGMKGSVRRLCRISASFSDMDGTRHTIELNGWPARVFQHECDHTEGRLYDDVAAGRCICKLTSAQFHARHGSGT